MHRNTICSSKLESNTCAKSVSAVPTTGTGTADRNDDGKPAVKTVKGENFFLVGEKAGVSENGIDGAFLVIFEKSRHEKCISHQNHYTVVCRFLCVIVLTF